MSYVSQSHANRPAAIAGVIAVHAGLGALLILGLTTSVQTILDGGPIIAIDVSDPPPPPPPQSKLEPQPKAPAPPLFVPPRPNLAPPKPSVIETTGELPPLADEVLLSPIPQVSAVGPAASPGYAPVAANPRNNPSRWVTDDDYKSRWVREGLSGTAGFRLEIGASGKVEACTITRSTGHAALDEATCTLITRRARFDPASNSSGAAIRGSYASSVRWNLPD